MYLLSNRVDTRYGHINQVENGGKQWYDGMAVQFNKRFSKTFQGTVATPGRTSWTRTRSPAPTRSSSAAARWASTTAPTADKGNGNLDQRHRFVGTFIARPTFMKSDSALAKYVVNGWELSGFLTLASGRPNFESVSFSSTTNLPQAFTGTLNGLGGDNRVPWLPNNPLMIDAITRFDSRLSKNIPIREQM